jgi:hypothetical protein
MNNDFKELIELNVNDRTEEKNGLTYLSWSWAWAEIIKRYPDATYEIEKFENNLPYVYDEKTGYMVFTSVSIDGITREMWLPVMDGANKAMLDHEYTYEVKKKEWDNIAKSYVFTKDTKTCSKATMFDINKTIMRCLTKNLAMFGLGLYIYSGEDLPEQLDTKEEEKDDTDYKAELEKYIQEKGLVIKDVCNKYKLTAKSKQIEFKSALVQLKVEDRNNASNC